MVLTVKDRTDAQFRASMAPYTIHQDCILETTSSCLKVVLRSDIILQLLLQRLQEFGNEVRQYIFFLEFSENILILKMSP